MPIITEDQLKIDERYMREALKQAVLASHKNEVPIGAIIVCDSKIIAKGFNQTETLNDVTAHAEMIAFTAAASYLNGKYLRECTLYVTVEPCVMCAGAAYWTQIDRIVYGAPDEKRGYHKQGILLHPKTKIMGGILPEECGKMVSDFFAAKRK
ncbi:MAG: nucleoside deaminase [Bacteroidetes bacterium]|nr:nucleoside deaminase [Bacteroidota bacterium]